MSTSGAAPDADVGGALDGSLFRQLAEGAVRSNLGRLAEIRRLLPQVAGPDERERIGELAHQVVGSAGTFGFDQVSDDGRRIEELLQAEPAPGPGQVARIGELVEAMDAALRSS